ncbi:DNA polymerase IV [Raoultibacter timonensis]|uniref:DNA polymerase IV n=2 Tax=Raoultibacter timonensis TaxID=1907662 RepID=A0ABN6MH30_9ACTN|nr:DNA polymerase IV [Raoultibacter timonensis]BDF50925.1 DNA polymerase IV [Raoultibacter timonensis]
MNTMYRTHGHNVGGEGPQVDAAGQLPAWHGSAILLVDLDAFFASVEQLDHPGWRGKPVIVGGDPDKRGVVSTASYEARVYGVRSAMPSSQAARLCPDAIWTHGHYSRYRAMSKRIMEILLDESPRIQQVSIDEAFLDISPTAHVAEHPILVAQRIQKRVSELGVTCSIGLGTTKTIAKIASDMDKPQGLTIVYPGREKDFLSPLPIRTMSGIGPAAEKELTAHGVRTLGELAKADESLLKHIFGKNAEMIMARANGGDLTPVSDDDPVKSVSNETSFAEDLSTVEDVEAGIATMASKVGRRLRKKGMRGHTVSLKLRFSDRSVRSVQRRLDEPTDDDLFFTPLLYRMAREIWEPGIPVRLIGVGMAGFDGEGPVQGALFDVSQEAPSDDDVKPVIADDEKRSGLLAATDKVKDRFGDAAVRFGREIAMERRTTGSGSKNSSDYK